MFNVTCDSGFFIVLVFVDLEVKKEFADVNRGFVY